MAVSLKHTTQTAEPDSADGKISADAWNEEHALTLATDKLLGRVSASTGAVEEVPCSDFIQTLLDDADAETARATLGAGGTFITEVDEPGSPIDDQVWAETSGRYLYNRQVANTFNPDRTWTDAVLSGGNLTVTFGEEGFKSAVSFGYIGPGQRAGFSIVNGASRVDVIGIANWKFNDGDSLNSYESNTISVDAVGNVLLPDGTYGPDIIDGWVATNTVTVAVNFDARLVWFKTNSGDWNSDPGADPEINVGGISFDALDVSGGLYAAVTNGGAGAGDSATFNPSPTLPTGYTAWPTNNGFYDWGNIRPQQIGDRHPVPVLRQLHIDTDGEAVYWDKVPATLNPVFTSDVIALSNGNLTATGTDNSVFTSAYSYGSTIDRKVMYEVEIVAAVGGQLLAVGVSAQIATEDWIGSVNFVGVALYDDGSVYYQSDVIDTIDGFTTGDTVSVAVDPVANLIWFKTNSGDWNDNPTDDPATGAGGIALPNVVKWYAGVTFYETDADIVTFDFEPYGNLPSGFSVWPNEGWRDFGNFLQTPWADDIDGGAHYLSLSEMTAPTNGAANTMRLFSRDNGSGKTQLACIFPSGAVQVIATEP